MKNVLIFGAYGSIGNHVYNSFIEKGFNVYGTTSAFRPNSLEQNEKDVESSLPKSKIITVTIDNLNNLLQLDNIDIIVWAQGKNCNDNIETIDENLFSKILEANVIFITKTL